MKERGVLMNEESRLQSTQIKETTSPEKNGERL